MGGSELPKTLLLGLLTAVVTFVLLGGVYDSSDAEGHQRSTINSGRVQVPQVAGGGATVRAANTGTMGRLQASNVTPASPDDSNPLGASKQPTQPQPGGGDAGDAGDTDGGGGPVPTLQRDLERTLASIAINKAVLVTTASNEFASVLANWLCHVKRLRMKNVLVIALDKETALQVQAAGVATLWDRAFSRANGTIGTFASKSYLQAVYSKTRHQRAVLAAGYNLFFSDTDIPWTHDWVGEIAGWALADGVDILLSPGWPWQDLNTGFFFARSTLNTLKLVDLLLELEGNLASGRVSSATKQSYTFEAILEQSDQTCLNFVLMCGPASGILPYNTLKDGTVQKHLLRLEKRHLKDWPWGRAAHRWPNTLVYDQDCAETTGLTIKYGVLRPDRFQTGHKKYGKTKWSSASFKDPLTMYHGNYLFGADQKIAAFKARNRWIDSC